MTRSPYGPCPNCGGEEIIRTPPVLGDHGAYVVISAFRKAAVAKMICLNCGFVREWVDNRADLDMLREKFGHQLPPR